MYYISYWDKFFYFNKKENSAFVSYCFGRLDGNSLEAAFKKRRNRSNIFIII